VELAARQGFVAPDGTAGIAGPRLAARPGGPTAINRAPKRLIVRFAVTIE